MGVATTPQGEKKGSHREELSTRSTEGWLRVANDDCPYGVWLMNSHHSVTACHLSSRRGKKGSHRGEQSAQPTEGVCRTTDNRVCVIMPPLRHCVPPLLRGRNKAPIEGSSRHSRLRGGFAHCKILFYSKIYDIF